MKESNKGITLMILSVTIILILIITSTATYYGMSAFHNAQLTKFETELKIIQTQVELWEEEGKTEIGKKFEEFTDEQKDELASKKYGTDDISDYYQYYKYLDTTTIRNLGIEGIEGEYFVMIDLKNVTDNIQNVLDNRVISVNGLKYRDTTYYTLKQLEEDGLVASTYSVNKSSEDVASLTNKVTGQVTLYSRVQDAIDAAGTNPSIVTLLKDEITESITVTLNQNIILDTNGKNLNSDAARTVTNNGNLTIEGNGKINNTNESGYVLSNIGTATVKELTLNSSNLGILNKSSLNINGCEILAIKTAINNQESGTIIVNSGKITSSLGTGISSASTSKGDDNPAIKICGGIIKGTTSGISASDGDIIIEDGEINVNNNNGDAYGILSNPPTNSSNQDNLDKISIKIFGGTIISTSDYTAYGISIQGGSSESTLSVSGNTKIIGYSENKFGYGIGNSASTGTITISSGIIEGSTYGIYTQKGTLTLGTEDDTVSSILPSIIAKTYGVYAVNDCILNFFDGIIKSETISNSINGFSTINLPSEYMKVSTNKKNSEGYYTTILKPIENIVATLTNNVGNVYYFETVQEAINGADNNSSIITLLKDNIDEVITIKENQNIILNTDGKTLTASANDTINNWGTLKITGEGTINSATRFGIWNYSSGNLTLENIAIIGNTDGINNFGNIIISNSTIEGKNYAGLVNRDTGNVTITGGNIKGNTDGIQNRNAGIMSITNGTIIGTNYAGLVNYDTGNVTITGGNITGNTDGIDSYSTGVLTLGINNTTITSLPTIIGKTSKGIYITDTTFNFYDGVVKAKTTSPISGTITAKPTGYTTSITTTTDSDGYYSTTLVAQ